MDDNSLTVKTRVDSIYLSEDDSPSFAEVTFWLNDDSVTLGVATIRMFFTNEDITLEKIRTAALNRGYEVIEKIALLYKPDPSSASLVPPQKE